MKPKPVVLAVALLLLASTAVACNAPTNEQPQQVVASYSLPLEDRDLNADRVQRHGATGEQAPPTISADFLPLQDDDTNLERVHRNENDFPAPSKRTVTYPNLGSQLDQQVAAAASRAQGTTNSGTPEPVAVTIHLSGSVNEVAQFIGDNGGELGVTGSDYIEAVVPVGLLAQLSELPSVLRVREIVLPVSN